MMSVVLRPDCPRCATRVRVAHSQMRKAADVRVSSELGYGERV
jgi:hypothetical protein